MSAMGRPKGIASWMYIAAATVLVGVPIVFSIAVPASSPRDPAKAGGWTDSVSAVPTRVPPVEDAAPASLPIPADLPSVAASPNAAGEAAVAAIESQMTALREEKAAIEKESEKLRKEREELENFEKQHPDGVSPALYSRYEDARTAYNSDVMAFKSRTNVYQMKVAELERRVDSLRAGLR